MYKKLFIVLLTIIVLFLMLNRRSVINKRITTKFSLPTSFSNNNLSLVLTDGQGNLMISDEYNRTTSTTRTNSVGGTGGGDFSLLCPSGKVAVGIYGKYGGYIDSIGVICQ